jgi:hypothetical protein
MVIVHNLTHGFLSFYNANTDCKKATDRIMNDLARRYHIDGPLFSPLNKKKRHRKKKLALLTNPIIPISISTDIIYE